MNRRGIADLPLFKTLLAIHQKSRKPSFWEVIDSFALLAYESLAASRTLLQRLLACLDFALESEDLSFWYKRKKQFLWTMAAAQEWMRWMNEMNEWDELGFLPVSIGKGNAVSYSYENYSWYLYNWKDNWDCKDKDLWSRRFSKPVYDIKQNKLLDVTLSNTESALKICLGHF